MVAIIQQRTCTNEKACEFLTQSPHAALHTENAHQDLTKSEEDC